MNSINKSSKHLLIGVLVLVLALQDTVTNGWLRFKAWFIKKIAPESQL